jgi:hypothetical protein
MKKFNVELILQPECSEYIGRRYIKIEVSAEHEIEAIQFAVEMMSSILKEDVKVIPNGIKSL